MRMLFDFKMGERIRYTALLKTQKVGLSANGSPFARGIIQDSGGSLNFISFESSVAEFLKEFPAPTVMTVAGTVDINKYSNDGALQIIIHHAELPKEEEDLSHLLPYATKDLAQYQSNLQQLISKIKNQGIRTLVQMIFKGDLYKQFIKNPAAMRFHHAYVGGLLVHSVDVAMLAIAMAGQIDNANTDIIIAGALLHDIGKVKEISSEIGFPYTEAGRMLGHISLGMMLVEKIAEQVYELTLADKQHLLHVLASHHGSIEKGSPVPCTTKESFIVHYADELNAIMDQFDQSEHCDWQFSKMLNRHILVAE